MNTQVPSLRTQGVEEEFKLSHSLENFLLLTSSFVLTQTIPDVRMSYYPVAFACFLYFSGQIFSFRNNFARTCHHLEGRMLLKAF